MAREAKPDGFQTIAYKGKRVEPLSKDLDAPAKAANKRSKKLKKEPQKTEEGFDKAFFDQFPDKDDSLKMEYYYKGLLNRSIYMEATSKLLPAEHVRGFLTLVGSKMRTLLTQLPDRLSPRISHESDEETIHLLLSREIEQITQSIIEETSEDKLNDMLSDAAKNPVIKSRKISQYHKG